MNDGVEAVPSDIWIEILRRIPAANLLRLKAVCKSFYAVISSNLFVQLHLQLFTKHPKRLIISTDPITPYQKYCDPEKRTISVWHDEPSFDVWSAFDEPVLGRHRHWVIESYHGILLVQIRDRLFLCNLITRSYKFLPLLNFSCLKLAYDDVSEQYKVFELRMRMNKFLLYVFDVRRDEYQLLSPRKMKDLDDSHIIVVNVIKKSVLVNGNVYWLVITHNKDVQEEEEACKWTCIVSANLTTEDMKTRTCSSTPYPIMYINTVFAANGTFYKLVPSYQPHYELQLWVVEGVEIENPNPSWRMKHCIDTHYCSPNSTLSNYD